MARVEPGFRRRAVCVGMLAVAAAPLLGGAVTASAVPLSKGTVRGVLGVEGGPYPGGLHPTSGKVEFDRGTIHRVLTVGKSGHFSMLLSPGKWSVTGCGGTKDAQCGQAQSVTVTRAHTVRVTVPWLLAP